MVYTNDRSDAVFLMRLLFCATLWILLILRDVSCSVVPCSLFSCIFPVLFSIVITSLGEEKEMIYMFLVHLIVYLSVFFLLLFLTGVGCRL